MAQCHKRAFVNHPARGDSSTRTAPGLTRSWSDRERSVAGQSKARVEGCCPWSTAEPDRPATGVRSGKAVEGPAPARVRPTRPPWLENPVYASLAGLSYFCYSSQGCIRASLHDWPGLGQVCCVERTRWRQGKETVERAYAITSLPAERADAARLLEYGMGTGAQKTACTGCGTWSLARTGARCEPGRRRNYWRRCGTWCRYVAAGRSEKHIGGPAPLRLETLGARGH